MNIGNNPTVSDDIRTNIEVHFFDLVTIYIEVLKLSFGLFKKGNVSSVLALKEQLKDEINVKHLIDLIFKI